MQDTPTHRDDGVPLVTAVIPTRNRPGIVTRAVRSALSQTYPAIEVVVVIDGPDPRAEETLAAIADSRVRVLALDTPVGGSDARNTGVRAARGSWIAFLDDDDEWASDKIEKQMAIATGATCKYPIVSCRERGQTPTGTYIWPRRFPGEDEPLSEYIFARRGLFQGEGLIQTSTLLVGRELLLHVPFRSGQRRHQEWDWILRASRVEGARVLFSPDVLATWYVEENRESISSGNEWRYSYEWIHSVRSLVTPRAYAAFLLTLVTALAAREGNWKACGFLLRESIRNGSPRPIDLALFGGMLLIPQRQRRRLRAFFSRLAT